MKLSILTSVALSLVVLPETASLLGHLVPAEFTKSLTKNQKEIMGTAIDSTAFAGASAGAMVIAQEIGEMVQ
jgi:hypothetical protein